MITYRRQRAGLQREAPAWSASNTTASSAPTTSASNCVPALARSSAAASSRARGAAVAAVAGHRVPGVAGEDDARAERDGLAGQAVGVAAAVPALVAGAHDAPHGAQRLGRADDALADDRVLADEAPLGLVERAGLVQDRVRDGDLADVVQLGGADHDVEVLGVEAQARAHRARELGDVVHVALQVGLALAQDGEQHLARLALGRAAAVLEGVHAVIGQAQRVGGGVGVGGQRDQAVGGVDREGVARAPPARPAPPR